MRRSSYENFYCFSLWPLVRSIYWIFNNNTMTHTQQFIEDAIEGGWLPIYARKHADKWKSDYQKLRYIRLYHLEAMLLDPLAWQAVGKVRGWKERSDDYQWWKVHWHAFISHLADGKTIEEALQAIA